MWRLGVGIIWALRCVGIAKAQGVLSTQARAALRAAEMVEVFSLGGAGAGSGPFHGAPVLGSVIVTSARLRRRLLNRILLANRYNIGGFMCLGAEYGVRLHARGITYDLTFCFDCAQVWANGSDGYSECGNIAAFPIPILDGVLTTAGVPLPPSTNH